MSSINQVANPEVESPQSDSEVNSGLSQLIRSKADAIVVYKNAWWFGRQDPQAELYELLEPFIDKWGTPSFTEWDVRMVERIVDKLCSTTICDSKMEYEGPDFGHATGLLEALAAAARQHVTGPHRSCEQPVDTSTAP